MIGLSTSCKESYEKGSLGPTKALADTERAHNFLTKPLPENVKPKLEELYHDYQEYRKEGFRPTYVVALAGYLNTEAQDKADALRKELEQQGCDLEIVEGEDVVSLFVHLPIRKGPDVKFTFTGTPLEITLPRLPRSIVLSIHADEFRKTVLKYRGTIFGLNLREYLGPKKGVNKYIRRTLEDENGRKKFWYLNLGIDAICNKNMRLSTHPRKHLLSSQLLRK